MVPNSQRGVFASSGFAGYWRRVQKSFSNYVGSSKMGRVPIPSILYAPTSNRRLTLPTTSIVSAIISRRQDLWNGMLLKVVGYVMCKIFLRLGQDVTSLWVPLLVCRSREGQ